MPPFSIKLSDGRILDHLDFQNAQEHVLLYGAEWINYDGALSAISAAREAKRKPTTIDARTGA